MIGRPRREGRWARLGLVAAAGVIGVGMAWAYTRGGQDFSVFYTAWKWVLSGRPLAIYAESPDRFLYAPGFAWIFAPLAFLPQWLALMVWCLLKAGVLGYVVSEAGRSFFQGDAIERMGLASWAIVLLAKPILIDFQYGQVNIFVLGACVWALSSDAKSDTPAARSFLSWAFLGVAALAKVFPFPLLLVPWLTTGKRSKNQTMWERAGVGAGAGLVLLSPLLTVSPQEAFGLLQSWRDALLAKGLPLESHNQSFSAFLHHYFSGSETSVISLGAGGRIPLGFSWIPAEGIQLLSLAWSGIGGGLLLAWLLLERFDSELGRRGWAAVAIAAMILPSHLVWKPYFVMGVPAVAWVIARSGVRYWPGLLLFFAGVNLSGFDFIGSRMGAIVEASAFLLWAHLGLIAIAIYSIRNLNSARE